jgi:uncharacterized protein with PIN domain
LRDSLRFIVDQNVGKLARWLRMMGYDTRLFSGQDDGQMIAIARKETRVILTRDTQIMKRRVVSGGQIKAVLLADDAPERQMHQVIATLGLSPRFRPFTICLECNQPLEARSPQQVKDLVPPYVFRTQHQYMACPTCHRVYWQGTHWQAMTERLNRFETNDREDRGPGT